MGAAVTDYDIHVAARDSEAGGVRSDDEPALPSKGCLVAVLLAVPFWGLLALVWSPLR